MTLYPPFPKQHKDDDETLPIDVRLAIERVRLKKMMTRWNTFGIVFNLMMVNFQIYNICNDFGKAWWHMAADAFCLTINSVCLYTAYRMLRR